MSRTTKPSKPSESGAEWTKPSELAGGDVVKLVHNNGTVVYGRVTNTYTDIGCRIRVQDGFGITLALQEQLIKDEEYMVKEINGNEMY